MRKTPDSAMVEAVASLIDDEAGEIHWAYEHARPYDYNALAQAILALTTDREAAALSRSQPVEVVGLVEALEAIQSEAERTNGSWVHLKRVIGTKARSALATFRSAQGEGNDEA